MTGPDNGPSSAENTAGSDTLDWDAAQKEIEGLGTQPAVKPRQSLINRLLHRKPKADTLTQVETSPLMVLPEQDEAVLENLPPQKRGLARKIGRGLQIGFKNWAMNVNPKNFIDKDWVWRAGAIAGTGESVAFMMFAPLPGGSWVKAGVNLALAQGIYAGSRVWHNRMVKGVGGRYAGEDLSDISVAEARQKNLAEIDKTYKRFDVMAKNFFMGLSAGATYASATGLGIEIFKSITEQGASTVVDHVQPGTIARKTYAAMPEAPHPTPPESPPGATSPLIQPPVFKPEDINRIVTESRIEGKQVLTETAERIAKANSLDQATLEKVQEKISQEAAAVVGGHLTQRSEVVEEAIRALGEDPAKLSYRVFDGVNKAVLEEMQSKATDGFALVQSNNVDEVINSGRTFFNEAMETKEFHNQLLIEAKTALVRETLKEKAASMVGEHLGITNEVVDQAIENAGHDPSQLSEQTYEAFRHDIQGEIEKQVNAFDQNFDYSAAVSSRVNMDEIVTQAKTSFAESLEKSQEKLERTAGWWVAGYFASQENVIKGIDALLKTAEGQFNPALVTEVNITPGTTVGQMWVDRGYDLTSWDSDKADLFGAHIAANYDVLNNYWGELTKAHNLPDGFHFPVDIFELDELIDLAKKGDSKALQKLKDALHWIPTDKKFKILSKAGVALVTRSLYAR